MKPGPIAYIVQKFPHLTITFIYREIQALRAQGIKVAAFSIWKPRRDELSQESVDLIDSTFYVFPLDLLRFIGAHLYYLFTQPLKYVGTLLFLWTREGGGVKDRFRLLCHFAEAVYLAKEIERQNVQHIHAGFASNPATLALIVSRLTGVSFSFAAHAYGIFAESVLLREKLAAASFVIASTRYNKNYLTSQFPDITTDKIKVIHHGVSLQDFQPGGWEKKNGLPMILFVAQFREKKGLPFLIEACRILKSDGYEFKCCVVGDGAQRSYIETLIEKYGLQNTVKLAGIVFQEHLKDYYRRADIFALPSIVGHDGDRDGIPVTLIEVMSMGRPVVSTFVSGIPELVEDGQTGLLVPPGDASALAKALLTLLRDENLRRQMGQAGRDRVIKHFDIADSVAQVAGLFVEELGK
ncbi:MAG: glycosyltransferase [Chloroflexota bacterium]|nr:glycosyltransferase [Chloroflexota bacterium]